MRRLLVAVSLASLLAASPAAAKRRAVGRDSWPAHPLLSAAQQGNASQYAFARNIAARPLLSSDGRTFALYWSPSNAATDAPVIVTLHGSDGYATAELYHWYPVALERGYAVLALQWWLAAPEQYLSDDQIFAALDEMLSRVGAPRGRNVLHGFSRGSARSYAITFLDRRTPEPWFRITVANAGSAQLTYPLYAAIERGTYGNAVFHDTHWVLFCGALDPAPDRDGCPAMRRTRIWLERHGGTVELLLEDPSGGHGGFHQNPANMRRALDAFDALLARQ